MPILVEKIQNGTVIDRIEAGCGMRVLAALGLASAAPSGRMALVINVPSRHMGHKDILKIEDVYLDMGALNRIALISPHARINIIRGGKVAKKHDVALPDFVRGIARCPNPKCISLANGVETSFRLEGAHLRCTFCERPFNANELL